LERGIAVRQGQRCLRAELPRILATPPDVLSPRIIRIIEGLAGDWRRLDERVEALSNEIEAIAHQDAGCERLVFGLAATSRRGCTGPALGLMENQLIAQMTRTRIHRLSERRQTPLTRNGLFPAPFWCTIDRTHFAWH
jgi:hypothetical protein